MVKHLVTLESKQGLIFGSSRMRGMGLGQLPTSDLLAFVKRSPVHVSGRTIALSQLHRGTLHVAVRFRGLLVSASCLSQAMIYVMWLFPQCGQPIAATVTPFRNCCLSSIWQQQSVGGWAGGRRGGWEACKTGLQSACNIGAIYPYRYLEPGEGGAFPNAPSYLHESKSEEEMIEHVTVTPNS